MAIAQLLAQILAAQYGRDVRQSIHDAIGECYDDVSTAKTLATDATNSANTAATLANEKATLADTKAGLADAAATNANTKATLANTKAGLADTAATNANNAATLANTKAGLADAAATNANNNIIDSATFIGNDMVFTKVNSTTVTIVNAKTEIKGDKGDTGLQGLTGNTGAQGQSAYEAALLGEYTGTQADFYADLAAMDGLAAALAAL